jgi:hypothetical protein
VDVAEGDPRIWSVGVTKCLFKGKRKHRHPAGCRQEQTADPHAAESGKGSGTMIGQHVHPLTEALITF